MTISPILIPIIQQRLYPYPIPPTVRSRTLGFDWEIYRKASTSLGNTETFMLPEGIRITVFYGSAASIGLQAYDGAAWQDLAVGPGVTHVDVLSDGTNIRVYSGGANTYWLYGLRKKAGRI